MNNTNKKKEEQLLMPFGTANNRLRKALLFKYVKKAKENYCYQCGSEIESMDEFSIEHKIPYLYSEDPLELFFNTENIAFSHISCNIGAARRNRSSCGTVNKYNKGCKCDDCRKANANKKQRYRLRKKLP